MSWTPSGSLQSSAAARQPHISSTRVRSTSRRPAPASAPQSSPSTSFALAIREGQLAVEGLLEHVALFLGGPDFLVAGACAREPDADFAARAFDVEAADVAVVAAVERVGHAEDAAELPDGLAVLLGERGVILVPLLRERAAVVAGHVGDDLALGLGEARQLGVLDEVERVLVVRLVRDVVADVVQERGGREQRPVVAAELVLP